MILKIILGVLFVLISSCATIPDEFVCADLDESTGYCVKTISDEEKEISGQEWQDFKRLSLKISVQSWANFKAYILKQCKKNKQCNEINLNKKFLVFEQSAFVNE